MRSSVPSTSRPRGGGRAGGWRLLVLGTNAAGVEIGCGYALAGHEVAFWDRDAEAGARRVATALAARDGAGGGRVRCLDDVAQAAAGCDALVEALPADPELAKQLLAQGAGAAPQALLVVTSSLRRVTDVGRALGAPERTVGMRHLQLSPLVEVTPGEETAARYVDAACALAAAAGRRAVVLRRDVQGAVWERLQLAVVRECAFLIEQGAISREGADEVVREGLARRWRHVGPLRSLVQGGLETWNALARNVAPELSSAALLPDLRRFTEASDVGLDGATEGSKIAELAFIPDR